MLKGFRTFLLRGNVVDLAVGVVIGTAFGAVVSAFASAFITPLIAVAIGKGDVAHGLSITIRGVTFPFYEFIDRVIYFVVTAAVVYFMVVLPFNKLVEFYRLRETPDPTTKKCAECLSEIPIRATRCAFCTQPQPQPAAA
jgi:large conductance mechanosensitive channel